MDGVFGIVASSDGAAKCFNSCDGGLRRAGHDDVNRCCEGSGSTSEEFDAVFDAVDGACGGEFAECDRFGWVNPALVDPVLDTIEVYG